MVDRQEDVVKTRLILASSSPRRIDLLRGLGLSFEIMPGDVSETVLPHEGPSELVERLALSKAKHVAASLGDDVPGERSVVIGADTVVVLGGRILGKPRSRDEAYEMLKELQGRTHEVYSGVAVVCSDESFERVAHEVTMVTMRHLTDGEIRAYVATGEPMDKAGAYAVQGKGALLISSIAGCYYNVVGLPLTRLCLMLRDLGIDLLSETPGRERATQEGAHGDSRIPYIH
ncbi:MAG TPA: septum formation inhibitor Maf [Clostridia bacterium]|nr:septum formation inhibitor Maf [Clostridia bacterium]